MAIGKESRRDPRRVRRGRKGGNHVISRKPSPKALPLPRGPAEVTLTKDTHLDGDDLRRFVSEGGVVRANGFRVFLSGKVDMLDLAYLK